VPGHASSGHVELQHTHDREAVGGIGAYEARSLAGRGQRLAAIGSALQVLQRCAAPRTEGGRHDVIIKVSAPLRRDQHRLLMLVARKIVAKCAVERPWPTTLRQAPPISAHDNYQPGAAGELPLLISLPGPVCCVLPLGIVPAVPLPTGRCPLPTALPTPPPSKHTERAGRASSAVAHPDPPYLLFPARPPPTARQSSRAAATYIVALPNTAGPWLLVCSVHPS
jgi:hypothetical protein